MDACERERTVVAVVLVSRHAAVDVHRLARDMADLLPLGPPERAERQGQTTVTFADGGGIVTLAPVGAPIPSADLAWPCETAFWWPTARSDLARHVGHLVVSLVSDDDRLTAHLKLTLLLGALLDQVPAVGVLWRDGAVLVSPSQYRDQVQGLVEAQRLPLQLWINIVVTRAVTGASIVSTTGLASFGLMEIECERLPKPADQAYVQVHDLAQYLITNGPVVRDGDTIGGTAEEKIRVRHARSFRRAVGAVYRLEFEGEPSPLPLPTRSEIRFTDRRPGLTADTTRAGRRA